MKKALLITVLALSSCQALDTYLEDRMDVATAEAYDAWLRAAEETETLVIEQEQEILKLAAEVKAQAEAGDVGSARLSLVELDQAQQRYGLLVKEYNDVTDRADAIIRQQVDMPVRGVLGLLDPVVPIPLQPLVPLASSLAVMLLSKRSRKHAIKGLKGLAKGNLGELLGFVLKAVGASHTSAATAQVSKLEDEGKAVGVTAAGESD